MQINMCYLSNQNKNLKEQTYRYKYFDFLKVDTFWKFQKRKQETQYEKA